MSSLRPALSARQRAANEQHRERLQRKASRAQLLSDARAAFAEADRALTCDVALWGPETSVHRINLIAKRKTALMQLRALIAPH